MLAGGKDSVGWLHQLDWYRNRAAVVELDKLDGAATSDILHGAGLLGEDPAANQALIDRLMRISEGEPLVLNYLIQDLLELDSKATAEMLTELARREGGFRSYFANWLERQRPGWIADGVVDERSVSGCDLGRPCLCNRANNPGRTGLGRSQGVRLS